MKSSCLHESTFSSKEQSWALYATGSRWGITRSASQPVRDRANLSGQRTSDI